MSYLRRNKNHIFALAAIGVAALLLNSASFGLSGVSPRYFQSSDATVHVVDWYKLSESYNGTFENDAMFQNYQGQSTGVLVADQMLVRIAEAINIDLLTWSIVISALSLVVFLSGVYFLVFYTTKRILPAFVVTLASIVPVISLGLSSWGFLVGGFVPKELTLGIAVWLTILYLHGIATASRQKLYLFFILLGLASNFYPVIFFHYAMILLLAEVLRNRAIRTEHIFYGLVFLAAAPVSLYDIFIKAGGFTPPDLTIIIDHYLETLHSWHYLIVHYLRKQIIYAVLIGALWHVYRRVLHKEYPPLIQVWYAIWWSSLAISLVGVGIELFAPAYTKYLLSRASVWFYLASMVIVAYTVYEIYRAKFTPSFFRNVLVAGGLLIVLLGQTSILNVWNGLQNKRNNKEEYQQYLSVVTRLPEFVPAGELVLANPDDEAKTVRVYGKTGSYVSWKDGNVTLFDGDTARQWFERYKATQTVFAQKDFKAIQRFADEQSLSYYLADMRDLEHGTTTIKELTLLEAGPYRLIKF